MFAYFFQHQLLGPKSLYIAALHCDRKIAMQAFEYWISSLKIEEITFQQQKLIALICSKYEKEIESSPHQGMILNIQRQVRVRAHINLNLLKKSLSFADSENCVMAVIGDLREFLLSSENDTNSVLHCDYFEFVTSVEKIANFANFFLQNNWHIYTPLTQVKIRNIRFITLHNAEFGTKLKIYGLQDLQLEKNLRFENFNCLQLMTNRAHLLFMQSRCMSLLNRRDQFLFDIYYSRITNKLNTIEQHLDIQHLPWYFRHIGKKILGSI